MDGEKALRERLVDVGVELVLEGGTSPVGLREIARRAGVSHGAPRRYFPTHRALLSAVARRGFEELGARSAHAVAGADGPRAELAALARAYLAYARERRGMFELMFRHELLDGGGREAAPDGPPLREATLPLMRHVTELVARCRGEAAGPPAAVTATALWAGLHGIAQLWSWGSLPLALGDEATGSPEPLVDAVLDAHLGPAAP
ncbi:TetR/AcrR family transcriptional regulator [Streptomyces albidoflavus]|uniref:TetR/AcrR family transcriptional regulator n=1 Tax=Streptomyces albidoflavus TaxID=1886 RepID=UPI0010212B78|nr:TetR/AcrR family transcriptional regulator [Streptomyces albidoflavus]RZE11083.1 TetR family transcriptional regulator [Streptomyces albidoflavus]